MTTDAPIGDSRAVAGTELEGGSNGSDPTELEGRPSGQDLTEAEAPLGGERASTYIAHNLPEPIAASYRIIRPIGRGGQASVYLAERVGDGESVAIKLYSVSMSRMDRTVVDALSSAPAEHIVPTEFGQWGEECWEIQEYLPLGGLDQLREHYAGGLPDDVAVAAVRELCDAVQAAHDLGLLHRDIKPSNILVRALDPLDLVLADFGLVRSLVAGAQLGSRSATPGYRSPDTAQGIWRMESDWWAVGITLFELLRGRHPFDDENGYRKDDITILGYLVENEVPLDGVDDPRWVLLLQGLLTKSADHRWGIEQVWEWLAGGRPDVHRSTPSVDRGWVFTGFAHQTFTSPVELGRVMAERWDEAAEYVNGRGRTALHNALAQSSYAERAHQIFDRYDRGLIRTDGLVFELVRLMAPDDDLVFRGRPLTADGLATVAAEAIGGIQGTSDWMSQRAIDWIGTAFREGVLDHTMGHPDHVQLAHVAESYAASWDEVDRLTDESGRRRKEWLVSHPVEGRGATDITQILEGFRGRWRGYLLRVALNPDYARQIVAAAQTELAAGEAPADWISHLTTSPTSEPSAPAALLLLALHSTAATDLEEVQADEEVRRRHREAEEAERRRQEKARTAARRRARWRRRTWPNGGDALVVLWGGFVCLTVLIPWLLGATVLRYRFGRDGHRVAVAGARKIFGASYVSTNWLVGCSAILLLLGVILLLRAAIGLRIGTAVLGVAALATPFLFLVPTAQEKWDAAEIATAAQAYDPAFENYYTCGGAAGTHAPYWSLWTFQTVGHEGGCNRLELYKGLTCVKVIDLKPAQETTATTALGAPITVADTSHPTFTYSPDHGKSLRVSSRHPQGRACRK